MKDTPIDYNVVSQKIANSGLKVVGKGSIREIQSLVNEIEKDTGKKFVRMEMGVPGLPAPQIGVDAEIEALKKGVASVYPSIHGIPELKNEMSRFCKLFLDIDVSPQGCLPTVGSMQGAMAVFMVANRSDKNRKGTLFIDPGFPVQKAQCRILGHEFDSFDVYDYRGEKLRDKLESYLKDGHVSSILYSSPNNPAWICLTDKELQIIAEVADKYDVVVIEDLAYFGMDYRQDYSIPGQPPYQPSVSKYTDNYVLLVSSSKAFSFAGERVGMVVISDKLYNRRYPDLLRYHSSDSFGYCMVYGALYCLSAGVNHSAQYGMAAMLKATNDGLYNFRTETLEYGEKARIMKKMFTDNGFKIVYHTDEDKPIADGFYFTFSYPGFTGMQLLEKLLYYGISCISLDIAGSSRTEGLRACVSLIQRAQFPDLEYRLQKFNEHHASK